MVRDDDPRKPAPPLARARARWAAVAIDDDTFAKFVKRIPGLPETLDEDSLAELYLVCGCCHDDAAALALFDAHYLDVVPAALAHMRLGHATIDEVRQIVREKLLVAAPGQPPKLEGYAGHGKLRGLIQVVAVRAAISMVRKTKREIGGADELRDLPATGHDPELSYMKATYREAFKRAFARAVEALTSRDRNFLRLHHFGGLTVEQVGDVYGVHRATATRWLAKIRTDVMAATRKHLAAELEVAPSELDSLMELIQSRLDVSVQRLLETRDVGGPPPAARPS